MIDYRNTRLPLFSLALAIGITCTASATPINWYHDIPQAVAESRRLNKPLLIKVTADWCGYCVKMQRETFQDPKVTDFVHRCFIPLVIDADQNRELAQRLGASSLPTTLIVSPKMEVITRMTGFKTADQLSQHLIKLCHHASGQSGAKAQFAVQRSAPAVPPASQTNSLSVYGRICPVSIREEGKYTPGNPAFTLVFQGKQLLFSSERHREMFRQNPERYWPVAGGNCIVTAVDQRVEQPGQLALGVIYADRVWLFVSEAQRDLFRRSPERYAGVTR